MRRRRPPHSWHPLRRCATSGRAGSQREEFGSAFIETDPEDVLEERRIRRPIVYELDTFGCVNQTVTYAVLRGYGIAVVKNTHGARAFLSWGTERPIDTSPGMGVRWDPSRG